MYRMKEIIIPSLGMHIVKKGYSCRIGRKALRGENVMRTSERQKLINRKRSEENRIYLILNNFKSRCQSCKKEIVYGDRWITLTYPLQLRPLTLDEAHKNFTRMLKKIKRKYPNSKYMGKTENTDKGNLHHHLLISRDVPHDYIVELWREFNNRIDDVEIYSLVDMKLANYFVKNEGSHKVTECKYTQSKNLVKPIIKVKILKAKTWRSEPKAKEGFDIIDVQNYFDSLGFEAQKYIMVKRC